ncbi:hypothetical protein J7337_004947 [Fusarium musae]|uniref:N-acetyltransferase B complex non catalytic subunit n=1 Tax=Fusarium musae TaxID=1042133 RepID=A0A9P8ITL2_9HYPO|nr:hypothetical protein J7337_004947 [Fusarium musae]KAG9504965.1 hypothetical protein J7337_004947 [Fusarium musae]
MDRRQVPNLKNGVDLQLQSAFNDGNWAAVVRLAEKRAQTSHDQYYEIMKICAESHLDDPVSKFAAITAIDKYVREGTVVKDVESMDLLEWASLGLMDEEDFPKTIGPLRVRLVKAAPKEYRSASRCLESCILHWDLVSAQQTAATGGEDVEPQPRSVQTEEEILLLYDVTEKHGSKDDLAKLVSSPVFSPLVQFRKGRKELMLRTISHYQQEQQFEAIFDLCRDCLSIEGENGQPSLMAVDWKVWQHFIEAATEIKNTKPEYVRAQEQKKPRLTISSIEKTVQQLLLKFIKSPNLRPIHKRTILLARVSAAFNLALNDDDDVIENEPASFRLKELISYVKSQGTNAACFDEIKAFAERLNPAALKYMAYGLVPKLARAAEDEIQSARLANLSFKLKYFAATCPYMYGTVPGIKPRRKCFVSGVELDASSPGPAFSAIAEAALEAHRSLSDLTSKSSTIEAEIRPELAVIIGLCIIQTAFPPSTDTSNIPISYAPLLRALLFLEHQLALTPKHSIISLLLVQLHLRVGSASRAREIWNTLGVKRTIVDSLAPIFYDRLSTISPALISSSDRAGSDLLDLLSSHFKVSLKLKMPRRLMDAFQSESYSSAIDIPEYIENLRWSCTRVMSLIEEVRTDRIMGERFSEVLTDPRFILTKEAEVADDMKLVETVDYGSFPSWDYSSQPPVYSRLRIGPPPTNRRAHLSLLSEAFHELLGYKPPPLYKASATAAIPDQIFVLESLSQLSNSFMKFSNGPSGDLTPQEATYFEVTSLLSTLIPFATSINRAKPIPEEFFQIMDTLKIAIDTLKLELLPLANASEQVTSLSTLHSLAILRDTSVAIKASAQWVIAFNDREKERDRSGKSNLPKEVMAQIRELVTVSEATLKEGKATVAKMKEQVYGRDFEPAVRAWIFEDADNVLGIVGEAATKKLVQSWESNVKGWTQVVWS